MPVQTTVNIPEPLYELLLLRAEETGASINSLILRAIEQAYQRPGKRKRLTGPMIKGRGKLGPAFPTDENPYDLVFS